MYQINGLFKMVEEDSWKDGCDPNSARNFEIDVNFKAGSVDAVIKQVQDFLGIGDDATERNACGEKGRIDFQLMECDDCTQPTKEEIASWKRGKTRLWVANYTAQLEKVTVVKA